MAKGNPPHKAKPSKQHSLIRSAKNKRTGKYERQRRRTEANKIRRAAQRARRLARRAAKRGL